MTPRKPRSADGSSASRSPAGSHVPLARTDLVLAALLVALVLFFQRRTWMPMFGPDDLVLLESARGIREWPDGLWRILSGRWFWTLGTAWFGVDPAPWHVLLWILHGAATLAAFAFVRVHGATRIVAFVSAAWFGTHAAVTDVLLPMSSVGEVLSATLGLTAVAVVLVMNRTVRPAVPAVFWAAALLAKESIAMIPFASWLVFRRRPLLILGVTGVAVCALFLALGQIPGGDAYRWGPGMHGFRNLFAYAGTALDLRLLTTDPAGPASELFGGAALVVLAALSLVAWRDTRLPGFGLTGFILALGPVLLLRDARFAHYLYTPQLYLAVSVTSLVGWSVEGLVRRIRNLPVWIHRTAPGIAIVGLLSVHLAHASRANQHRYGAWIEELELPRDPLLRKMVVIANARSSVERSLGSDKCRLLILWPPSSGYTVGTRSGIVPAAPAGVQPATILESVLDQGLGLRAIFPQITDVRMTDTWNPVFRGWRLATSLVNGQLIVLGSDDQSHRQLAAIWREWGYEREAADHMARVAASDGRRLGDGERRPAASTVADPVR